MEYRYNLVAVFHVINTCDMKIYQYETVADLRGVRGTPSPRPKFFQFHAVFGKIWQNRMLAPPLGSWRPLLGEILDPPL